LEGPTESAEVAKAIVIDCMSNPFNGKNILRVALTGGVENKCPRSKEMQHDHCTTILFMMHINILIIIFKSP
jgi:phage FluMu protein Com